MRLVVVCFLGSVLALAGPALGQQKGQTLDEDLKVLDGAWEQVKPAKNERLTLRFDTRGKDKTISLSFVQTVNGVERVGSDIGGKPLRLVQEGAKRFLVLSADVKNGPRLDYRLDGMKLALDGAYVTGAGETFEVTGAWKKVATPAEQK